MKGLITYLTFNGNCREAMLFYQDCLGGELTLQTVGDTPAKTGLPDHMRQFIVHSTLKRENLSLMGTDMVGDEGLIKGNNSSILIECSTKEEAKEVYDKLSEKGRRTHPVKKDYWGALFGGLKDKYGNHWLIYYK